MSERVNDRGEKVAEFDPPLITQALNYAKEHNFCKAGRKVLYIHGLMEDQVDEYALKEIIDV